MTMFKNLHTLRAGENRLPMAKLGALPALVRLYLPFNYVKDLDLEVEGKFSLLEVSYKKVLVVGVALVVVVVVVAVGKMCVARNKWTEA
jgi:hypothetical protein